MKLGRSARYAWPSALWSGLWGFLWIPSLLQQHSTVAVAVMSSASVVVGSSAIIFLFSLKSLDAPFSGAATVISCPGEYGPWS